MNCHSELVSESYQFHPTSILPIRGGRSNAFTLAEVLITLVIIGVIAAITVPTLITKYQKEQTVTRLKKAYSALSQTAVRAIADNGPMSTWEVGESNSEDAKKFLNKYMIPYLSIMKEPTTYTEGNWDRNYSYLNNQQAAYNTNHVRFYLNDGTSITAQINKNSDETSVRLMLRVDINGDKKPNKVGRDIFFLDYYIKNNNSSYIGRVRPEGLSRNRNNIINSANWGCRKDLRGSFCSGLIMFDGWRIADDYPW